MTPAIPKWRSIILGAPYIKKGAPSLRFIYYYIFIAADANGCYKRPFVLAECLGIKTVSRYKQQIYSKLLQNLQLRRFLCRFYGFIYKKHLLFQKLNGWGIFVKSFKYIALIFQLFNNSRQSLNSSLFSIVVMHQHNRSLFVFYP